MRRPLTCTCFVFVMVLFLLQKGNGAELIRAPIVCAEDERSVLSLYEQGDTVIICGRIRDYSVDSQYGQIITELSLNNNQILPPSEAVTKENHLLESDDISHFQEIGTKRQQILVYLQEEFVPVIGSYVMVSGRLAFFDKASNPGEFDACRFYSNRGYLFAVKAARVQKVNASENGLLQSLKEFRMRQEAYLERYLPDGNDAIMKAMLFGNKKEMDEETKELYQKNGIAHILAISGLHISLLGMSVYKVFLRLPVPKGIVLLVSGVFLVLYCFMVGISASTFRALIMFAFFLLSKLLKRSYDMITAMAFSAMLWLMFYPGYLFDCGFQLSYTAIMGMGIVLPALTQITDSIKAKWIRRFITLFLPSLSVNLMTAPVLIYHYHELSFFSIALNLIVIPLMAPLLLCGIGMLAAANRVGGVTGVLPFACAVPVNVILWIYEMGCRLLEWLPIGRKNIASLSLWELVWYYSILIVMTVWVKKKCHYHQFILPMACICILLLPQKHDFAVWTLDVGQGDCNVIFTEGGNVFVIDCGSTSRSHVGERILIPFLKYHGIGCVDGVIVSHPDEDHMNGVLELLESRQEENIEISRIYIYKKGVENEAKEWEELIRLADEKQLTVSGIGQGDVLQMQSFRMECIYPLEGQKGLTGNASSLVITVESGDFSGVFTGDLESDGEKILRNNYKSSIFASGQKQCDFLKVAHHGSSSSSDSAFLHWINPRFASVSCGKDNRYGHPHEEVLMRMKEEEILYWITHEAGAIKWTTDIPRPWLQSGR